MANKKMGRPKKKIDYNLVEKLAAIFCQKKEIASILDVSYSTATHDDKFSQAYDKGRERGKMSLRRSQMKLATTNSAMAIFLGKNYLDQTDSQELRIDDAQEYFAKVLDAITQSDTTTD